MDIHYNVRMGEVLPHIESFIVKQQTSPCPPGILETLHHKLLADISKNPCLREFTVNNLSIPHVSDPRNGHSLSRRSLRTFLQINFCITTHMQKKITIIGRHDPDLYTRPYTVVRSRDLSR